MRHVVVAKPTGLCFGVRRAIDRLENALRTEGTVYALGMPIHNPQEVERLSKIGAFVVEVPADIPRGAKVFIRAHGISPDVYAELESKECDIIDGTCPFVKKAQDLARFLSEEGYHIVIVGDNDHPEVRAIRGCVSPGNVSVVSGAEEARSIGKFSRIGVISQTTQKEECLAGVATSLVAFVDELRVFNTICKATVERQQGIRELARNVDGVIVIGGRNSANTGKLVDIVRSKNTDVLWIEHAEELDGRWHAGKRSIGIAAGASTPDWLIDQLKTALATSQGVKGDGRL